MQVKRDKQRATKVVFKAHGKTETSYFAFAYVLANFKPLT